MANVKLNNIKKRFGDVDVLHGIDLDIKDGEFVVLIGESGCGKSTLLRLLSGLEDITEGDLYIDDERVNGRSPAKRGIAMVFQSYALYPHMNVFKNMAFGLKISGKDKAFVNNKVMEAAKKLKIDRLLERLPRELSGGQRQRVAIGRAIVRDPKVFLFDEPLSNLDASLRVQTRVELGKLHQELKATVIYVTHDQVEAMTLGDKIVVMNKGRVEQVGAPLDLYHHPKTQFVAGFIGSPKMNFLTAKIHQADPENTQLMLESGRLIQASVDSSSLNKGDIVQLGLRPEHIVLDCENNTFEGKVTLIEHLGELSYLYVDIGRQEGDIVLKVDGDNQHQAGDKISFGIHSNRLYVFDHQGNALTRVKATSTNTGPLPVQDTDYEAKSS
ncbi:sn-glycerol-3-phosphate ABC transporter ATP-binding protein UgpC [Marinomonas sp. M1K-6]|uniref:sn-glycerol-3-phosphate ABC transporter ATP-binding protein UgpC n=1 Tax=Marinomonas profundi TaxID=2726122 RepID=A0A847RAD3_9GAMM|nr:sn-glycerol-3-phosphate ABC transporter ATP-binding protein UgpC [Marinomonas profundi]NLQ17914.1 sn-glycerol-3-phosphate ABC transporter ATP-binding protein UgpC [Marinomonas profundi]UDV03430.1 sn-glycerol-3-phosphate ABC transporter ATP-binding protein UgpC [Marinomonas profundi]